MPYFVYKKINDVESKCTTWIIQLDKSNVKFMGELKDVMIKLASGPRFCQINHIIVVDNIEVYRFFFSGDWSRKLEG